MNIGLFTDSYKPEISGVVTSIETLREALEARGHHVYVFTSARPDAPKMTGVFRLPSMPLLFLKTLRFALFYTPRAAKTVRRVHLDIIHTHTEFSLGLFGKLMSFTLRIPIVHTYHTMYQDYTHYVTKGHFNKTSKDLVRVLSRNYCNGCQLVIAPTQKVASLLEEYGVKRPVRVIPSGVKLDRFRAAAADPIAGLRARSTVNISPDTPLAVFVGRVAKEKSIDMLLQAMLLLKATKPHARLLIVGDGPERNALENQAIGMGLKNTVLFAGSRPWEDIPDFYCAGNLFVSASTTETQGLTVLEAMASGVPVLARNDPSYASMVTNGQNGMLFDDANTLFKQMDLLFSDTQKCQEMSRQACITADEYAAAIFGKRVESVYQEALTLAPQKMDFLAYRIVGQAGRLSGKLRTSLKGRTPLALWKQRNKNPLGIGKFSLTHLIGFRRRPPRA